MKIDITLYNLSRDDLIIISSKALREELEIQEYIKKLIRKEANKLREEQKKLDEEILDKFKDMTK